MTPPMLVTFEMRCYVLGKRTGGGSDNEAEHQSEHQSDNEADGSGSDGESDNGAGSNGKRRTKERNRRLREQKKEAIERRRRRRQMKNAAKLSMPLTIAVEVDHPGLDVPVTFRMLTGKMTTAPAMEWTTENLQALYKMGTYDATQGVKRSPFRPPEAAKRGGFERSGFYLLAKPRLWLGKRRAAERHSSPHPPT